MTDVRIRQVALCARDLEATIQTLQAEFGLGEPYRDPAVGYFGLANAVFAIGDTFLEVVSPVRPEEPGARTAVKQLERSGSSVCGYMALLQVGDLAAARARAQAAGAREVFEVELDDIAEVHLHPGDMQGAIVSLTQPDPPASWRWGGDGWADRAIAGDLVAITVDVADPDTVKARWEAVAGGRIPGCQFRQASASPGIAAVELHIDGVPRTIRPAQLA